MKTGPTSYETIGMINAFEKLFRTTKKPIFKRVVKELKASSRNKRCINLSKINRYSIEGSNVLVLGKLLGSGELKHKINVIAFDYSSTALSKLKDNKSKVMTLRDWSKKPDVPSKVILFG